MATVNSIPEASYGILQQNLPDSALDKTVEQVRNLGYAVIDSGCTMSELSNILGVFNYA